MDLIQFTWTVVPILSVLTIAGQIIAGALVLILAWETLTKRPLAISAWIGHHGLWLLFIVVMFSIGGSLYFSEIAGWNPCKYCWIQRIFMYPQCILVLIALWKRDATVARYIIVLSALGAALAAYHFTIQMFDIIAGPLNPATPCDASGESCVKTPFAWAGYVTIPMMALTAFLLNVLGSVFMLRSSRPTA